MSSAGITVAVFAGAALVLMAGCERQSEENAAGAPEAAVETASQTAQPESAASPAPEEEASLETPPETAPETVEQTAEDLASGVVERLDGARETADALGEEALRRSADAAEEAQRAAGEAMRSASEAAAEASRNAQQAALEAQQTLRAAAEGAQRAAQQAAESVQTGAGAALSALTGPSPEERAAADAAFEGVEAGAGYGATRARLLEGGWSPRDSALDPEAAGAVERAMLEAGYEELEGCKGAERPICRFEFEDGAGRIVAVMAIGADPDPRVIDAFVMDLR